MNDIFRDMVDVFVIVYLDNILTFSEEGHKEHVKHILKHLHKHNLHAKLEKCVFHVNTIEYLSFIVSPAGIAMDPSKTKVIANCPVPRTIKEVQSFLGFANFYHCFINNYSDIIVALNRLMCKDVPFNWTVECQATFQQLKDTFTTAPILMHFNPCQPIIIETDGSDYAITAILSQILPEDNDIHPVAFHSQTMQPAELNYKIYNKELLAIYEAFKHWCAHLEGTSHSILVMSDHKNLEYFTTTKVLTWHQGCWLEFLSGFVYNICYHPCKVGAKPDALMCRRNVYPQGGKVCMQYTQYSNNH